MCPCRPNIHAESHWNIHQVQKHFLKVHCANTQRIAWNPIAIPSRDCNRGPHQGSPEYALVAACVSIPPMLPRPEVPTVLLSTPDGLWTLGPVARDFGLLSHRRSCSSTTVLGGGVERDLGDISQALRSKSVHNPLAKSSARCASSVLPTEPVPEGLCNNMTGMRPKSFHALVSASTLPSNLALNRSRKAKLKLSRSRPSEEMRATLQHGNPQCENVLQIHRIQL